jgi:hypothetical protein
MGKCEKEGQFTANIMGVSLIEHRFNPEALEIRVDFEDANDGNTGRVYLDLSEDYATAGARKGERQCDIAADTLHHLGVDIRGPQGLSGLNTLDGRKVSVTGKVNTKGYLNFYLNTSKPETAIDVKAAAARMKALFGGAPAADKPDKAGPDGLLPPIDPGADEIDGPNPF